MKKILYFLIFVTAVNAQIFEQEFLFPQEKWHNHSASIVELPNGDLLVAWYHGSGEGQADDVRILGMRKRQASPEWSESFLLADTPDLPDLNPVLFLDTDNLLWLFWSTYLDNSISGVLIKYRISTDYARNLVPEWKWQDIIHIRPRNFETLYSQLQDSIEIVRANDLISNPKLRKITSEQQTAVKDKLQRRLGWMTRTRPIMTSDKRLMLGIYHDLFACGLAAFTENQGNTWSFSQPIQDIYLGLLQPTFVKKSDGGIVCFLRDNGLPKQIRVTESQDGGISWSQSKLMDIPNPGSSVQSLVLNNNHWLLVCNDLKRGRYRLTVFLSEDEGKSWPWRRELDNLGPGGGELSYPSLIQGGDGKLHGVYTYATPLPSKERNECIRYVHFNESWIRGE